ncbi:MAG: UDP-N-acetylmuramoyl-L-alanine--D-glutamate ligase [Chlamydiae bacterium]|nr:UDP-N-acetylmuramoyl-L-alanine--D-glutamate ligase [Chlamydiota bacterium]MBI3267011.1 UDP-N-acetylmuramoyl-L-alanine--D-glutamate ligase [Chlamydiota bacterium]
MQSLIGKKALVIGLGESGLGASLLLKSLGASVRVTDSSCGEEVIHRAEKLPTVGVEVELGIHSENFCREVDFAILSPGIPLDMPLVKNLSARGVPVLGELEWASQFLSGKIIAVTGSNGKSTTATLIWKILSDAGLKATLAGNIGLSLSRAVLENPLTEIWVLEVSSFQLEAIGNLKPWVSLLLNVTANHLDRYPSMEAYGSAKAHIFRNQNEEDWALVNRSCASFASSHVKTLFINSKGVEEKGCFVKNRILCVRMKSFNDGKNSLTPPTPLNIRGEQPSPYLRGVGGVKGTSLSHDYIHEIMPVEDIALPGKHNLENVMFAVTAASLCGISLETIRRTVSSFSGLEHRQEIFAKWEGARWVNDSKATSVDAVRSALEVFPKPILWLAGGRFKGGDFELLKPLLSGKVKKAYFYGEAGPLIYEKLKDACKSLLCSSLKDVVHVLREQVSPQDTVLLSPGCSSFDQFKNFEERGRYFKDQVRSAFELSRV